MGLYMIKKTENNLLRKNRCVFNPFVNASHTDAERHYFGKDHPFPCESRSLSHGNTRASLHYGSRRKIMFSFKSSSELLKLSYLGSVRAVTNQWGSPLYMFDYDVFGQPLQDRPERYRHGFTGNRQRKLQGKEYDSWTGLYNYGFRDYSAMFGRFTSVDPIQDGHNWYAYVNSDPVSWLDPWGLCPQDAESGEDPKRNAGINERTIAIDVTTENLNVGHTRLFYQDENENWYRFDQGWNGVSDFACSIGLENSGKANVLGLLLGSDAPSIVSITPVDGPAEGAHLIKTTVEQNKLIATAAQESQIAHNEEGKKYNLYTNNCTDSIVDILNEGGIHIYNPETTPLKAYLKTTVAITVNPVLGILTGIAEVNKLINTIPIIWQKRAFSSE